MNQTLAFYYFCGKIEVMADKTKENKITKILEDLNSTDSKKVTKAVKSLEAHGDVSFIKPLADKLMAGVSEKNKTEIIELLSSLKDTSVCADVMDIIEDKHYLPIRQTVLSTIWNTKVDFSDYIDDFVLIATTGTFLETLDCLTIIENLEGPFMEENILECQLHLKNYIESNPPRDEQKAELLSEIAIAIKDFNENLQE